MSVMLTDTVGHRNDASQCASGGVVKGGEGGEGARDTRT